MNEEELSDEAWLIRELREHEGAEGFSVYLRKALEDYDAGRPN